MIQQVVIIIIIISYRFLNVEVLPVVLSNSECHFSVQVYVPQNIRKIYFLHKISRDTFMMKTFCITICT